jgi:DNA polymerase I-like protein with 3'-5' exonuclease and polymerase domains
VLPYAAADADYTRRLWHHPAVQEAVHTQRVIYDLEKQFLEPLRDGIRQGVFLDRGRLEECAESLARSIAATLTELRAIAGEDFNPSWSGPPPDSWTHRRRF